MARIAHLSDTHLLEDAHATRPAPLQVRLRLLSFGRPLDPADRRARLRRGLRRAALAGADHVVLTGDLTEDGLDAQFEALAEVLDGSPFAPSQTTLIAGNHDAYDDDGAWDRALEGPLRPWRETSARGAVTVLDDVVLVPVSTRLHQPMTRAAGRVPGEDLALLDRVAHDPAHRARTLLVPMHHPPLAHALPGARWVDGIENLEEVRATLLGHERLFVLHGHTHRATDRPLARGERARVHSTTACVEHEHPLRLYDAADGALVPLPRPRTAPARVTGGPDEPTALAPAF